MMGLETLLEAAQFLEYKAEVEARGEESLNFFLHVSQHYYCDYN